MTKSCENCPLNLKPYLKREVGLKKERSNSADIIIRGLVGIQFIYAKQNLLKVKKNY